jgi:uncharacterized protein (TIGR01777 family)
MMSSSLRSQSRLHIVVSGASGLIGSALVRRLATQGHRVTRLVRRAAGPGEIAWNPGAGSLEPAGLEGADAVVHLSGENVGARWSSERKARIRFSRVASTRLLSETLAGLQRPPEVLVSASAVGIYGNRGDDVVTEESPPGDPRDFLVSVTREWEQAAEPARVEGIRVVHPRFGVVLSPAGGALRKMLLPFRLGLGARLGSGRQWMSWISIDDAVQVLHHALIDDRLQGPINVTSPEPVTNRDFTRTLARVLSRPALLAVPESALRLALGDMAEGTVLSSIRAVPARLLQAGYRFGHPDPESALRHVLHQDGRDNFPP